MLLQHPISAHQVYQNSLACYRTFPLHLLLTTSSATKATFSLQAGDSPQKWWLLSAHARKPPPASKSLAIHVRLLCHPREGHEKVASPALGLLSQHPRAALPTQHKLQALRA